ncbi:rab3 GTPase-activating protein catalytic subunit-like isoform X2 [Hibiscus syriacus]|uniref:rab3 GTPase-activating protein catalytic subunit-like isoform X2 n=1 Tax=Hibiscus syriacus TaxID=106335 RepID=UPI00192042CB|nr:rab3 GTPase-activating protein catalytic subunit-like isoform X2 [Hibiscus syriacus]
MEAPSFVSRARIALHSAAAKAERVLTDLKSDLDCELSYPNEFKNESPTREDESKSIHEIKHSKWMPANLGTKQEWQERFKNIRLGRKGVEDSEKVENSTTTVAFYDENLYFLKVKNDTESKALEAIPSVDIINTMNAINIPPTSVIKQLALAIEAGSNFKSMKDLLASSGNSSPVKERTGLSFSAVKSLVLRDKEDKLASDFGDDARVLALIHSLFDTDGDILQRDLVSDSNTSTTMISLPKDIHAAPPHSFVVKLSEVIGSFSTLRKMALFWCRVVTELRRFWFEGRHLPGIPVDETPDLNSCLLYQQIQVINCCISRKRRHSIATESFDSGMEETSSNVEEPDDAIGKVVATSALYARISTGELVLRQGANQLAENMTMLETGEPIYSPITQEGPLLTEDLIKETEELVLRTGSVGAGCSQLLSDMQAFKAANPGCILEDFVRWISPPDWTEAEPNHEVNYSVTRGQLSCRMKKEGNLWHELWDTAKPIPAIKQTPLFDEDLAVEGILNFLEDIPTSDLFQQLFVSLLSLGFTLAEEKLSGNENLSKLFYECKDYVVATCQKSFWNDKMDDLCQVYETVEKMVLTPEEVIKTIKQAEETPAIENGNGSSELKRRFKRLSLNFGGKDKQQQRKSPPKDRKDSVDNPSRSFASFFDSKSSLFSKISPKNLPPPSLDGSDWTLV